MLEEFCKEKGITVAKYKENTPKYGSAFGKWKKSHYPQEGPENKGSRNKGTGNKGTTQPSSNNNVQQKKEYTVKQTKADDTKLSKKEKDQINKMEKETNLKSRTAVRLKDQFYDIATKSFSEEDQITYANIPQKYVHLFIGDFTSAMYNRYKRKINTDFLRVLQQQALLQTQKETREILDKYVPKNKNKESNYKSYSVEDILGSFMTKDSMKSFMDNVYTETGKMSQRKSDKIVRLGMSYSAAGKEDLNSFSDNDLLGAIGDIRKNIDDILQRTEEVYQRTLPSFVNASIMNAASNVNNTGRNSQSTEEFLLKYIIRKDNDQVLSMPTDLTNNYNLSGSFTYYEKLIIALRLLDHLTNNWNASFTPFNVKRSVKEGGEYKETLVSTKADFLQLVIAAIAEGIGGLAAWHAEYTVAYFSSKAHTQGLKNVLSVDSLVTGGSISGWKDVALSFIQDPKLKADLEKEIEDTKKLQGELGGGRHAGTQLKNDVTQFVVFDDKTMFVNAFSAKAYGNLDKNIYNGQDMPKEIGLQSGSISVGALFNKADAHRKIGFSRYIGYNLAAGTIGKENDGLSQDGFSNAVINRPNYTLYNPFESDAAINRAWSSYAKAMLFLNFLDYLMGLNTMGDRALIFVVNGRMYSIYEIITGILYGKYDKNGSLAASVRVGKLQTKAITPKEGEKPYQTGLRRSKSLESDILNLKLSSIQLHMHNMFLPKR